MRKLLKFLKPYAGGVVAVICVLVVQAFCDLSLPTYTSDIVNVGIQQGGIDETVPETIAKEDLEKLLLFVPSKEQEIVMKAYTETTKSYGYDGIVMELKSSVQKNEEKMEQLSSVLGKPMFLVTGFDSDSDMTKQMRNHPALYALLYYHSDSDMTKQMQEQMQGQRDQVIEQIDEKISDMPDSMIDQAAASYIRNAYEHIGMDVDEIEIRYVLHTGGKMLALAALGMVASILVGLMASRIGAGVGRGLRRDVFRKVVGFSNGEFDKFSTASLITRSTNDIQQIQMLVVMILRMIMYAPIMAIGGIWKVFHTNVDMSWIIALAVGIIVIIVAVLFIVVMPKFQIMQKLVDRLNLVSREILTGLQVIRAFGTQKHEEERFDVANKDLVKTNLFVNRAMTLMMPLMMFIMNGIGVLIVWVGGHSINDGAMQVGDMMAFIQYTMQIIMSFLMICMISVMLPRAAVSAERVDEVLKSDTMIHDPKQPKRLSEDGKGEVVFDHVSFRYPGADEDVLHDISFTAKPGETTAFIGSTGCGKSTLVNLIPRFYDVTEGRITIDGKDIREVSQHELREKLGYVPQKGILFSGDIASNIMYGNPEGSEAEMLEAASIAQATEFIEQKKKKYHSAISQGGSNVSGGQKQRLSIARAIAKHPDVYIFDDSFSALDYRTDATLRAALKEKTADSTVMIVAQRISTILHAEQIIVLEDGQIVGKGTHKELLKNCDAYYQIASSQMSEQELENDMKEVG